MDLNDRTDTTGMRSPSPTGGGGTTAPSTPRPRRRIASGILKGLVAVVIIVGAMGVYRHLEATRPATQRQDLPERTWMVTTVVAQQATVTPKLVLYGTVVAGREAELRPLVMGSVVRVGPAFKEGGIVRKGDLLVEIDPFDYLKTVEERRAQLKEARSRLAELKADLAGLEALAVRDREQLDLRQTDYDRKTSLRKSGSGTQKALDDASIALNEQKARVADREARIEATKARIEQQEAVIARSAVALERAEKDLRETKLVAPYDGFLRDISTAVGKRVGVGDKVATLIDARRLEVEFQVSDEQYGRLVAAQGVLGKDATVVWRAGNRGFRFKARIERVSARVSAERGGVNLYAHLYDIDTGTVLRPGVFVNVEIDDRTYAGVFRLPDEAAEAIDTRPGTKAAPDETRPAGTGEAGAPVRRVYVVVDGRLQARRVEVVGRAGNDILVRGDIRDGERVVAETFPEIGPGVKVEVR